MLSGVSCLRRGKRRRPSRFFSAAAQCAGPFFDVAPLEHVAVPASLTTVLTQRARAESSLLPLLPRSRAMSPYLDPTAAAPSSSPPAGNDAVAWSNDQQRQEIQRGVLDEADWKLQRKLKQQRDAAKRGALKLGEPIPRSKFKSHHHQHHGGRPSPDARLDKDFSLAKPIGQSAGRSIPGKRREKAQSARMHGVSRSLPSAESWPPVSGVSSSPDFAENANPNWAAPDVLSTSEPKDSYLSRSYGSRREARTMTLFESASFYNESGHLLSPDNLDELGSSPDMPTSVKRKPNKRRVGRGRKSESKRTEPTDTMNPDEVVLELMCFLLPDVDVGKELNLLLLGGGQQHNGDVFHFDDDEELAGQSSNNSASADVNMMKFQASLTSLVFGLHHSEDEMPPRGTAGSELLQMFMGDQWVSKTVLDIVKLDVLAQYNSFAVLDALFRVCPDKRFCILNAVVTASLAIFEHQGINTISAGGACDVAFVSMKGTIKFLSDALAVIERDLRVAPELFGDSPDEIDDSVMGMCDRISQALKLLVRCSPGTSRRQDENANQTEKFSEASESAEATTYRSLGELLYHLATFCPFFGEDFMRWMLHKWPLRNVQLELFFVRFTAGLLSTFMKCGLRFPPDVVQRAFARIQTSIRSPQFLIAKEACTVCGNLPLMEMYLSQDSSLRSMIAAALHENATSHWNMRVRAMSDECFDMLLDLA